MKWRKKGVSTVLGLKFSRKKCSFLSTKAYLHAVKVFADVANL